MRCAAAPSAARVERRRRVGLGAPVVAVELDRPRHQAGEVERVVHVRHETDALAERVLVGVDREVQHPKEHVRHPDGHVRPRQRQRGRHERVALEPAEERELQREQQHEHGPALVALEQLHGGESGGQQRRERRELRGVAAEARREGQVRDQQHRAPPAGRGGHVDRRRHDGGEREERERRDVHPARSTAIGAGAISTAVSSSQVVCTIGRRRRPARSRARHSGRAPCRCARSADSARSAARRRARARGAGSRAAPCAPRGVPARGSSSARCRSPMWPARRGGRRRRRSCRCRRSGR